MTSPPDGLPSPERGRAVLVIVLGIAMAVMDGSIVNLALPGIARELNAGASQAIWVVNAYQIASLVMLLPLAALGDRLGYRRVYLVGMALFVLASAAAMLASSLTMLTAARALQGLGAAGIMSVNAALVRLIYPSASLGRGIAINSMVVATSSMAGPAVAASILSVASWPWLFALNLPLGLLTLSMGRRALPFNLSREGAAPRFSLMDVLLNVLMFTLVFVGADQLGVRGGETAQATPVLGWSLLGAGVLVGVVYLRRQWNLAAPMFPLDLLRMPVFALSMGASLGAFCAQMLAMLSMPFLLLEVQGRSHMAAGLIMMAWPMATALTAPIAGRLIGRYPDGGLGGVGMLVFATGLLLVGLRPEDATSVDMAWRLALCGAGFALFQSPNNHTIVTTAPLHRSGAASGMLGTARLTGQTIGAVMLAAIYGVWNLHDGQGETVALCVAAGCALLAGVSSSLRVRH
ncbi:DHA2 family multidrug resistance protein-like MFS transporter [Hydrogenophaga palleronii]|uniref:DHA2 family multidrug resistance protein-like MFS transporter n=1 Tax=Hydrogenophaga palleronii TaxID=65655 RepID=A0ABU1WRD8_9BURK|nr:MFS transporter [Hydrogenophaga palleronii]MDR7151472.1 DHA2 family multidrug resistance protein-like MFS transporter [Hydrogenophaga palleronii]